MSQQLLVDEVTAKFLRRMSDIPKKTMTLTEEAFRATFAEHLERQSKPSSKSVKPDVGKKLDTWPRIWVSTMYGGKTYFAEDYARVRASAEAGGNKAGNFQILARLRTELEGEDGRERWLGWVKWVQSENSAAPETIPSDRQPKVVKKLLLVKTGVTTPPKASPKASLNPSLKPSLTKWRFDLCKNNL